MVRILPDPRKRHSSPTVLLQYLIMCKKYLIISHINNFLSIKMLPVESQTFFKGHLAKSCKLLADLSHLDPRSSVFVVFRFHVEVYGTMIMIQYLL